MTSIEIYNKKKAEEMKEIREAEKARFNPAIDCGAMGRRFELDCARPLSKKSRVSSAGKADVFVKFNGKYVPAECKTNGGRIEGLLDGSNKSKFVIYRLEVVQKHKACKKADAWEEHRYITPVIIPTELFLGCLLELNAFKEIHRDGKPDGIGIQCSSKKLYERLQKWEVKFDPARNYTSADFEGLTL